MDLVYLFKDWGEGEELKVSLRTVEKHLKGYDKVWIVGMPPRWIQNANVLEVRDVSKTNKQVNAITKLLAVCNESELSDDFVLMNDDFFFLKDIHVEEIKPLYKDDLQFLMDRYERIQSRYYYYIRNTVETLGDRHAKNYEVHYPLIINKHKFKDIFNNIDYSKGVVHRSIYMHLTRQKGLPISEDVKVYNYEEFLEGIKTDFISVTDKLSTGIGFKWWVRDNYNHFSNWENPDIE